MDDMLNQEVSMASPWITFYREVYMMFEQDEAVRVVYNDEDGHHVIRMFVNDIVKAAALNLVMPTKKVFGDVGVDIVIVPPNDKAILTCSGTETIPTLDTFAQVFSCNPVMEFIHRNSGAYTFAAGYVVFQKKVVQFYNDNLGDYFGNVSMLYADIANDIFIPIPGIFFCTNDAAVLRTNRRIANRFNGNLEKYSHYYNCDCDCE